MNTSKHDEFAHDGPDDDVLPRHWSIVKTRSGTAGVELTLSYDRLYLPIEEDPAITTRVVHGKDRNDAIRKLKKELMIEGANGAHPPVTTD